MLGKGRVARGDLYGGLTAAVIALPLALAFGVAAVAPLGPEHAPTGALIGLLGAMFTGFFAARFGGTPAQITGPTGPMTTVVTLFIAESMAGRTSADVPMVMTLTAFAVALGGALQIAIGWLGGGKLVRYIPYPVVAGFMNGIAAIIFLGQIKPFFGVTGSFADLDPKTAWVPALIGVLTIASVIVTKRLSKTVPGSLVAIFVGIAAYIALAALGYAPLRARENTLLVGPVPNPFTSFDHLPLLQLGSLGDISALDLRRVLSAAVTVGVLGSIDSLLTSVVADTVTNTRHDSKKELYGQGIGNVVSGLLGGLAGAGATVRTLVNIQAGGRSRHAGMIHSAVIFAVAVALGYPAGWIPRAALAGILIVTAWGIVDRYALGLIRRRFVRNEFALMLAVASVTVAVDLMLAVAMGIGTAAMLFILQQLKTGIVVRRLRGDQLFSRVARSQAQHALLTREGAGTFVYQLGGALFFGTTDAVFTEVEADGATTKRVILDVSRVRDIDLSGVQLLLQLVDRFRSSGTRVAISGLARIEASRPGLHRMLVELGVFKKFGEDAVHPTLDRALAAFEDRVLVEHGDAGSTPLDLACFEALEGWAEKQRSRLAPLLMVRTVTKGDVLARQGAAADAITFVRDGRLALVVDNDVRQARVAVFGRGEVYGARAFFADTTWQASLIAEELSSVYELPRAAIEQLRVEHPDVVDHLKHGVLRSTLLRMDALRAELALLDES